MDTQKVVDTDTGTERKDMLDVQESPFHVGVAEMEWREQRQRAASCWVGPEGF